MRYEPGDHEWGAIGGRAGTGSLAAIRDAVIGTANEATLGWR